MNPSGLERQWKHCETGGFRVQLLPVTGSARIKELWGKQQGRFCVERPEPTPEETARHPTTPSEANIPSLLGFSSSLRGEKESKS